MMVLSINGMIIGHGVLTFRSARQRDDNIYTERFWRIIKFEAVYLRLYQTPYALLDGLASKSDSTTVNGHIRALITQPPAEVYFQYESKPSP